MLDYKWRWMYRFPASHHILSGYNSDIRQEDCSWQAKNSAVLLYTGICSTLEKMIWGSWLTGFLCVLNSHVMRLEQDWTSEVHHIPGQQSHFTVYLQVARCGHSPYIAMLTLVLSHCISEGPFCCWSADTFVMIDLKFPLNLSTWTENKAYIIYSI